MRKIVVGIDGSAAAASALHWAVDRAAESGARIAAVHVLTFADELWRDVSSETISAWRIGLRRQLREVWASPSITAGADVVPTVVEADSAAEGILAAADRNDADLIVLGADGSGSLADRLLGATTYKVSHRAHVPVVIVPAPHQPPAA